MSYLTNPYMVTAPVSYLVEHTDVGSADSGYGMTNGTVAGESAVTSSSEFVGKYFDNVQIYINDMTGQALVGETLKCSHSDSSGGEINEFWTINLTDITSTAWYGDGLFSASDATWNTGDILLLTLSLNNSRNVDLIPLIEFDTAGESWDGADSQGSYNLSDQELKDIFFICALN